MDTYKIVEQHWPSTGPHSADTVTDAADAMSALVRYMNNATRSRERLNAPQLWRVLASLAEATTGMDQLLQQLAATARRLTTDQSDLYDDRQDRQAVETALHVWSGLTLATVALGRLGSRLWDATAEASHLGNKP